MQTAPRRPSATPGLAKVALCAALFWLAFALHSYAYRALEAPGSGLEQLGLDLPRTLTVLSVATALTLATWPLLIRLSGLPGPRQGALAAVLIAAVSLLFEPAMRLPLAAIGYSRPVTELDTASTLKAALTWLAPLALWILGGLAFLHQSLARDRERRLAAAQAEAQDAQMRALRYQINPHFLFNTLNSISSLILARNHRQAEAMVGHLSRFFRATLDSDPLTDQPLAEELELQRRYLAIEQTRFCDFLKVRFEVPKELQAARVPPLILQPVIENALKHGLHGPGRLMTLRVSADRDGGDLVIVVEDDGRGSCAVVSATGLGLKNVEARLATRFPGRSAVTVKSGPCGFSVRLRLPLVLPEPA